MIHIGIDPGKKGGIAIKQERCVNTIRLLEMPLVDNEIDVMIIAMFLRTHIKEDEECLCIIEKAQSMPGQGRVSISTYMEGYGELKCMLKFLKIPFQEVRPQVWKKEFNLNSDKKRAVSTAANLFPSIADQLKTSRGRLKDGVAEALLMAEYGRRKQIK